MRSIPIFSATAALRVSCTAALVSLLAACGGGGGQDGPSVSSSSRSSVSSSSSSSSSSTAAAWQAGVFAPSDNFKNFCASPRVGVAPYNDLPYPDQPGTVRDQNNYLRSISNEIYLWYDEIADRNPANYATPNYFDLLKTTAVTPTGTPKDQFHWSEPTDVHLALTESGISAGYGANVALLSPVPPREAVVVFTEPGSPAAALGIERGARILRIDGIDLVNDNSSAGIDTLNAGLFPAELGESHTFEILDLNASASRTVTLTSREITIAAVQKKSVIASSTGDVGYLAFNSHIAPAEAELVDAINFFEAEGISDLVLDLRYNGGGYLAIASQLAYMIAGDVTIDKVFETIQTNDKRPNEEPWPFFWFGLGLSVPEEALLPTLNLQRIYVLAGFNTCSASESIINSLQGIDVEVVLIGGSTCGKPYGALMLHNCGMSYFTAQFKGANHKGWGDYTDGFFPGAANSSNPAELPGCLVADDFDHVLGDPSEARLAAALYYREHGSCPAGTSNKTAAGVSAQQKARAISASDGIIRHLPGLGDKLIGELP